MRDSATSSQYADLVEDSYDLPNLFLPEKSLQNVG